MASGLPSLSGGEDGFGIARGVALDASCSLGSQYSATGTLTSVFN